MLQRGVVEPDAYCLILGVVEAWEAASVGPLLLRAGRVSTDERPWEDTLDQAKGNVHIVPSGLEDTREEAPAALVAREEGQTVVAA